MLVALYPRAFILRKTKILSYYNYELDCGCSNSRWFGELLSWTTFLPCPTLLPRRFARPTVIRPFCFLCFLAFPVDLFLDLALDFGSPARFSTLFLAWLTSFCCFSTYKFCCFLLLLLIIPDSQSVFSDRDRGRKICVSTRPMLGEGDFFLLPRMDFSRMRYFILEEDLLGPSCEFEVDMMEEDGAGNACAFGLKAPVTDSTVEIHSLDAPAAMPAATECCLQRSRRTPWTGNSNPGCLKETRDSIPIRTAYNTLLATERAAPAGSGDGVLFASTRRAFVDLAVELVVGGGGGLHKMPVASWGLTTPRITLAKALQLLGRPAFRAC